MTDIMLCSACSKVTKLSSGLSIGMGPDIAAMLDARPTWCSACQKRFCLGCAYDASKARKLDYNCCPDCGKEVPDDWVG